MSTLERLGSDLIKSVKEPLSSMGAFEDKLCAGEMEINEARETKRVMSFDASFFCEGGGGGDTEWR